MSELGNRHGKRASTADIDHPVQCESKLLCPNHVRLAMIVHSRITVIILVFKYRVL
jgi:hypothetical protein